MVVKSFAVNVNMFPNTHAGLEWTDMQAPQNWDDALRYCVSLGGRLPNIQELRTLIVECPETEYPLPAGQDWWEWCAIEDPDALDTGSFTSDCNGCSADASGKYSVFGYTGGFWSSSPSASDTGEAWQVAFLGASVGTRDKSNGLYVMCVR